LKVLVIRAEYGKVVESDIVEGDLYEVTKEEVKRVIDEWEPRKSDFVVARDVREIEIKLPIDPALYDALRDAGIPLSRGKDKASAMLPIILVSFDSTIITEDEYQENKVLLIAPYINDDLRAELEAEAAEITSPKKGAEGIIEA